MKCRTIALTGNVGSGKSRVGEYIASRGFTVVDCDELARRIADLPQVVECAVKIFGKDAAKDGKMDRKYVRSKLFDDEAAKRQYEQLFFDRIKEKIDELRSQSEVLFVEIPLFDAFAFDWSEVWLIRADKTLRAKRVSERDGVALSDFLAMDAAQKQTENFDVEIVNDGSIENLFAETEKILKNRRLIAQNV